MATLLEQWTKRFSPEEARDSAYRGAFLDFTEALTVALRQGEVSRSALAEAIGRPRSFVSKVLRRGSNPTLRTLSDLAHGAGFRLRFQLEPITAASRAPQEDAGGDNVVFLRVPISAASMKIGTSRGYARFANDDSDVAAGDDAVASVGGRSSLG